MPAASVTFVFVLAMFGASFRSLARPVVPRAEVWKRLTPLPILALFLAACGFSGGAETAAHATHVVRGPGFSFSAPAAWDVDRTARSVSASSDDASVSAERYRLAKAYRPAQFRAAARELDAVAAKLARATGGSVVSSETTSVAGRSVRAYRIATARKDYRVGFVLDDRREVQLLCQAPRGRTDPAGACALLFASFRLG